MRVNNSVSKMGDGATLRKINLSRNAIQQRESSKPLTRLKSNHDIDLPSSSNQLSIKPQSSSGKRPVSSRKQTETMHSITTSSSGRNEEEIKQAIHSVFTHSKKLQQFLSTKGIEHAHAYQILSQNQLFTLQLIPMLKDKNQEEASKCVERMCIHKLSRIISMEKQVKICDSIQSKIEGLIDKRIKQLGNFS